MNLSVLICLESVFPTPTEQEWGLQGLPFSMLYLLMVCKCGVRRLNVSSIPGPEVSSYHFFPTVCAHFLPVEFSSSHSIWILSFHFRLLWWSELVHLVTLWLFGTPWATHMLSSLLWVSKVLLCFWRRHWDTCRHDTEDIPWVCFLWAVWMQLAMFCGCQAALRAKEKSSEEEKVNQRDKLHCPFLGRKFCCLASLQQVQPWSFSSRGCQGKPSTNKKWTTCWRHRESLAF